MHSKDVNPVSSGRVHNVEHNYPFVGRMLLRHMLGCDDRFTYLGYSMNLDEVCVSITVTCGRIQSRIPRSQNPH